MPARQTRRLSDTRQKALGLSTLLRLISSLVIIVTLISPSIPAWSASSTSCQATPSQENTGYWHTAGTRIVDSQGNSVRIAAVNWFGMENKHFVPEGLQRRPLNAIMATIRKFGFNAIRLPFSNELVERNPVVARHLAANPDLKGLRALEIMDRIVKAAGRYGLRIILDNGRSSA